MRIYVDLDGVVADFCKAVALLFGKDWDECVKNHLDNGGSNTSSEFTAEVLNIKPSQMWAAINNSPNFWEEIPEYDNAKTLYEMIKKYGDVYICTSPGQSLTAPSGKMRWLKNNNYKVNKNFVITPEKYLLAGEKSVLIDDTEKQIDKFNEHGGIGILYPQVWNKSGFQENQVEYVENELKRIQRNL